MKSMIAHGCPDYQDNLSWCRYAAIRSIYTREFPVVSHCVLLKNWVVCNENNPFQS
jgi:hypothetical protein